jgi:selenoprotein W-related protein
LATVLLENLKTDLALLELEPSGGGCFEVTVDGEEIYSKLATGEFPEETDILQAVRGRAV